MIWSERARCGRRPSAAGLAHTRLRWLQAMQYADYLAAIQSNVEEMVAALDGRPGVAIPSCPGWTGLDLLAHLSNVMAQKVPVFGQRLQAAPERGSWAQALATDKDLGPKLVALAAEVVGLLAAMGDGVPLWSWYQRDKSSGFWARRLTHEAVIHRVDAQLAAGLEPTCPAELAADGVGELLEVFLGRPGRPLSDGRPPAVIHLHGTDQDCDWSVTLGGEEVGVQRGHQGVPAALLAGPAAALYLWGWGRRGRDGVLVTGDPAQADRLRAIAATAT